MMQKTTIYDMVTERICQILEQGEIPWRKPWVTSERQIPMNLKTRKEYRGINIFLLASCGFSSRYWLSFKQAKDMGGTVQKGERGSIVVFWKWREIEKKDEETGETEIKKRPLLRYYTVFNLDQINGIDKPDEPKAVNFDFCPIQQAEQIITGMPNPPSITHNEDRAYYRPSQDKVNMPPENLFKISAEYFCTAFHELIHATGHESRLNRSGITDISFFGSHEYSKEELIAEFGAAFLCGAAGIENQTVENSAAYIQSWLKKLRNNKKWLVTAAAQAQKAADYILNNKLEEG
jgi:antirestriction protein ArdC